MTDLEMVVQDSVMASPVLPDNLTDAY